ncbi:hypothetical protein [Empedobacter stercoris]|uniref:Uncharacterized protein n=1 Tax=Empedobacter stercoris TaxID=1628248 RepID=A0ABX1WLX3_9FLAO|nr:hypothetical protein [Empedobacter stercoris]NOJ75696.1 hypothetical protein [Empedobacter stercoris]
MLITATTVILAGLSADVRRQSFLESYVNDNSTYPTEYLHNEPKFNNDFYLDHTNESRRFEILNELEAEVLNNEVRKNAVEIIRNLPALFLINFDMSNLYVSSYGTTILEYETHNSNFTIEIGEKSFGYFSEVNGNYLTINEDVSITELNQEKKDLILGKLNTDFIDYYYSL